MYQSDYGYATSGGSTTDRATCLNTYLDNWSNSDVSDCKNNDWLLSSGSQWTLSPGAHSIYAYYALFVGSSGGSNGENVFRNFSVRPVVYLSPSVGVQSGDGTSENPFELSGN